MKATGIVRRIDDLVRAVFAIVILFSRSCVTSFLIDALLFATSASLSAFVCCALSILDT